MASFVRPLRSGSAAAPNCDRKQAGRREELDWAMVPLSGRAAMDEIGTGSGFHGTSGRRGGLGSSGWSFYRPGIAGSSLVVPHAEGGGATTAVAGPGYLERRYYR